MNTYREWTPAGFKRSFHRLLTLPQLFVYISALWLVFLVGIQLGSRQVRSAQAWGQHAPAAAEEAGSSPAAASMAVRLSSLDVSLECSITCERFVDPVLAPDGHTYERSAIEAWLKTNGTSPISGEPMADGELRPNWIIKSML